MSAALESVRKIETGIKLVLTVKNGGNQMPKNPTEPKPVIAETDNTLHAGGRA
jgi:hypothetical protein